MTTTEQTIKEGSHSPWGTVQEVYPVIPGMIFVSTAGHGGIKLSRQFNAKMPAYLRKPGGWYEEDCEWSLVFAVFEKEILSTPGIDSCHIGVIQKEQHKGTFRSYYPDQYERFYGVTLKPGESYSRDRQIFEKEHANDFVVVSAVSTKNGFVRCTATRGGKRESGAEKRTYLVQSEEYDTRGKFSFVIDEDRHSRLSDVS